MPAPTRWTAALGTDSLIGGDGNDTYVIDNAGDKISETGAEINDRILASINIDLTAYAGIEHVTLTGSSALNATGDGSANMLIGNSGANHLDGKAGADTLIGGTGNDVYEVDSSSDQVIEYANGGIDQVNSSDDFILGAGVENPDADRYVLHRRHRQRHREQDHRQRVWQYPRRPRRATTR